MKISTAHAAACMAALATALLTGADWPRFRGPDGDGLSDDRGLPETWSGSQHLVWKTALPGYGASSPITLGDKVFVTCYSGYGLNQDKPGETKDLQHHLICLQAADGRKVWDQAESAALPEGEYHGFVALHGYASGTPVTDGRTVYAFFGRSGVFAYDLSGRRLWHADVGQTTHPWGSGTSPIIHQNLVIVNASVESTSVVALDKNTGREAWRFGGIKQSWSTPALVALPNGATELVISLFGKALALDPATGKQLWQCVTLDDYVCPSVIAHDGIVFITAGRTPTMVAIRAGGEGDVTPSRVLWKLAKSPKVATPLYEAGLLHWVDYRGTAVCVEADTGKLLYERRLEFRGSGDKVYASMIAADGKLYAVSRQGGTVVLAAGREFKKLAQNDLGDQSVFNATPAVHHGRLLLRSDRFLYCIGK